MATSMFCQKRKLTASATVVMLVSLWAEMANSDVRIAKYPASLESIVARGTVLSINLMPFAGIRGTDNYSSIEFSVGKVYLGSAPDTMIVLSRNAVWWDGEELRSASNWDEPWLAEGDDVLVILNKIPTGGENPADPRRGKWVVDFVRFIRSSSGSEDRLFVQAGGGPVGRDPRSSGAYPVRTWSEEKMTINELIEDILAFYRDLQDGKIRPEVH